MPNIEILAIEELKKDERDLVSGAPQMEDEPLQGKDFIGSKVALLATWKSLPL